MNKLTLTIGAISAVTVALGTSAGILAAKVSDKNRRIENLKANLERSTEETEYTREYWKGLLKDEEERSEKYYKEYLKMQDKYMAAADWERKFNELQTLYRATDNEEESNLKKKLNEYFANLDKEVK